jgi:4-hydroxy 2-oxovalerate aldolase
LSSRLHNLDKKINIIATSNVTKTKGTFDFVLEYSSLLDEAALFVDNPMIMLLKLLDRCEAKHISLAGFDGYTTARTSDYVNPNMEYSFSKTKAIELNNDAIGSLARLKNKVPYNFITKTYYVDLLVK